MTDKDVLISIVIPVKNAEPWLHDCLRGIQEQTLFSQTEIVLLDSGSTDNTLEIAKTYPVRLYSIRPEDFNHGLTRNVGVKYCKGKYVVMTVQDAKPTDSYWLQKLLDGFSVGDNVAGVCGQQVVPKDRDKNPVDWFRPVDEPKTKLYAFKAEDFDALSPAEKKAACSWDDVNAMYKREVMDEIPFRKISYGEDVIWAREALRKGYTLVYQPSARVYHYHNENVDYMFRRSLTVMYLWYKSVGFLYPKEPLSLRSVLSMMKTIAITKPLSTAEKYKWMAYNFQRHRSSQRAYQAFFAALAQGEESLDELHEKYCGKPPVPLKPTSFEKASAGEKIFAKNESFNED
ncbi:glycosyltransferase family 2 protein [Flavisolibacter ginsenosidimutans]|uniref:Glycosyltransferase n=1 Tax=Flavisolibacter ginsenosidimutans TaxID=661481 RepID=A0A5B8UED4_9BACT|nr:glycosyltransferase [Flavisolibacter ginsenosidimutans]QEC54868.1 glycosyltransferase [Flavisolibacter ginsenosidimutans]